jgi:hypothetical protein
MIGPRAASTPLRTARLWPEFLRWPSTRSCGISAFRAVSRALVSSRLASSMKIIS